MRKILYLFGALVLVACGGGLWIGFQAVASHESGVVLGAATAWPSFWNNGQLFLVGSETQRKVMILKSDGTIVQAPVQAGLIVDRAAASPDGGDLLLVAREGSQEVFWRYQEGKSPEAIQALRGDVQEILFATDRFVLVRMHRSGMNTDQLLLLDIDKESFVQVSTDTVSMAWMDTPAGVLSTDSRGSVWFYALQLNGKTDPPQLLPTAASTVATAGDASLFFVSKDENGNALKTLNLVTKEQRLITPLDPVADGARILLYLSPDHKTLIAALPPSDGQENGGLVHIDLGNGKTDTLPAIGRRVRWFSDDIILYERTNAGIPQVWKYSLSAKTSTLLFPDPMSAFSS